MGKERNEDKKRKTGKEEEEDRWVRRGEII